MHTTEGINGMSKVAIHSSCGSSAEIYLQGAHLTSWKTAEGVERFFLSPRSEFEPGKAIRGGVPLIFPQFSGLGPLPRHGFARNLEWELIETGGGMVRLRLTEDAGTMEVWPHPFTCETILRLGDDALEMTFAVSNTGSEVFSFQASLHGYFAVGSLTKAEVRGLGGLRWRDNPTASEREDSPELISFGSEIDRTFYGAGDRIAQLIDGAHRLRFTQMGFDDTVVWNPGPEVGARIGDLEPTGYRQFVCVEAASIEPPVSLAPGSSWTGLQKVECLSSDCR